MKVIVKLTYMQLIELIKVVQNEHTILPPINVEDKVSYYLFQQAFSKLLKKQIDKSLSGKKEFKITFSYPEAAALWNVLGGLQSDDDYTQLVTNNFSYQLHQNLIS